MGDSNLLFESIFKRKLSDVGTREYLTQVTKDHPYFAPAQFFLLLETERNTIEYEQQAAKTSILFNNPYWLQFQLQETKEILAPIDIAPNEFPAPAHPEELVQAESVQHQERNEINTVIHPEPAAGDATSVDLALVNNDIHSVESDTEVPAIIAQGKAKASEDLDVPALSTGPVLELLPVAPDSQEIIPREENHPVPEIEKEKTEAAAAAEQETQETEQDDLDVPAISTDPVLELAPVTSASQEIIISTGQNIVEEATEEKSEAIPGDQPTLSLPPIETEAKTTGIEPLVSNVPEQQNKPGEPLITGHFNNETTPLINEPEAESEIPEQEIAPMNFRLNIDTSNVTEDRISFEPLHTSDYFASLGIKLSGEIKPSDKLGKQLKSFTEWLKTMKKIHGDQLPEQSGQTDQSIQQLAEQSNKDATVLTEAMAEVLLQQGKVAKAIEVYKKLSLLNPSKSTYFAAKIDQLKEH
ncbi:MAG: hypothetical protein JWP81_4697 [Ferruginibacter sp.]|nr:hypothetical protein [Ferruginibacter sp.]